MTVRRRSSRRRPGRGVGPAVVRVRGDGQRLGRVVAGDERLWNRVMTGTTALSDTGVSGATTVPAPNVISELANPSSAPPPSDVPMATLQADSTTVLGIARLRSRSNTVRDPSASRSVENSGLSRRYEPWQAMWMRSLLPNAVKALVGRGPTVDHHVRPGVQLGQRRDLGGGVLEVGAGDEGHPLDLVIAGGDRPAGEGRGDRDRRPGNPGSTPHGSREGPRWARSRPGGRCGRPAAAADARPTLPRPAPASRPPTPARPASPARGRGGAG